MSKGDTAHAAQHQHGVQFPKEAATVAQPVTDDRLSALEARVKAVEEWIAAAASKKAKAA